MALNTCITNAAAIVLCEATANSVTDDSSADATGTAGWFRVYDSTGLEVMDGECGTSGVYAPVWTPGRTYSNYCLTSAPMEQIRGIS